MSPSRRLKVAGLCMALLTATACSAGLDTLGGRTKCWPDVDQRAPSLWRGVLRIDASGPRLETPENEVIPLLPGALGIRFGDGQPGALVQGPTVVATTGDDVTLYGGAGSDGALVVCAVEENRGPA